jgi:signal transduction histidine kinase
VQELLNNIVKHAKANNIVVSMNFKNDQLSIRLTDNGKGFDVSAQIAESKGLGLRNIYYRLKLIKGTIDFRSEPGKGTTTTIEIQK